MEKISVIIPSYNHGKYIHECLNSVLNQSYQNFEIVIVDDASTDNTVAEIKKFNDPRIKLYINEKNYGASYSANLCLSYAEGEYIAMLSSDDSWLPNKLEQQITFLKKHPEIGVVFTTAQLINEQSKLFNNKKHPYFGIFNQSNRSKEKWLRYFFYSGNCLCHPSALIRKEVYQTVGQYNNLLAGLPDFEFWIRVCLYFDIYIIHKPLIRFRIREAEANASGSNPKNHIRNRFEYKQVLDHYLKITDPAEFQLIFPEADRYAPVNKDTLYYILARIALDTKIDFFELWGLEILFKELSNSEKASILRECCGFSYTNLNKLTSEYDIFKCQILPTSSVKQENYMKKLKSRTKNKLKKILNKLS